MRKKYYRVVLIIVVISEFLAIIFMAAPLVLQTPVPFIFINSDSMVPVIKTGDLVIVRGYAKEDIESLNGEVIAFFDPSREKIMVHRAVAVKQDGLITQGDNSSMPDFFSPNREYILGRVIMTLGTSKLLE